MLYLCFCISYFYMFYIVFYHLVLVLYAFLIYSTTYLYKYKS